MAIFSRFIGPTCVVIGWLSVSLGVQAEVTLDVTENSRLVQQEQLDTPYYTLPISAIRKVNGVIGAEYNLQLSGPLSNYTWEILPGLSAKISHDKALKELQMADAQVIYQCHGRGVGRVINGPIKSFSNHDCMGWTANNLMRL